MGGDILKAISENVKDQDQKPEAKYDRFQILKMGISKWSYEAEVTTNNIESLDEETATWAFKEILSFNEPRTEEETKNG